MILHLAPGSSLLARAVLRGSPILFVPEVAILGLLVFWLLRVGFPARARSDAIAA
jgi:hypothetical protein